MHVAFAPDGVFVLFDLPKEQTVYAYPSGAFGWLGIVSQGFRPELMTTPPERGPKWGQPKFVQAPLVFALEYQHETAQT